MLSSIGTPADDRAIACGAKNVEDPHPDPPPEYQGRGNRGHAIALLRMILQFGSACGIVGIRARMGFSAGFVVLSMHQNSPRYWTDGGAKGYAEKEAGKSDNELAPDRACA